MINQPHEGGLFFLEHIFYNIFTQDAAAYMSESLQGEFNLYNMTAYPPPLNFGPLKPRLVVGLYTKVDSTTWVDSITYQEDGFDTYWFEPLGVFNGPDDAPTPSYDTWINGAGTSNMVMTLLSLRQQAGQNNRVQEIGNVPQIQFPEVVVSFSGALSGLASQDVVGYYVKLALDIHEIGQNSPADPHPYGTIMLFRELFDTPVTPANGVTLRFTPLLRLGNISSNTTLI